MTAIVYPENKFTVRREIRKRIPSGTPGLRFAEEKGLQALERTGQPVYGVNRGLRAMQEMRREPGDAA